MQCQYIVAANIINWNLLNKMSYCAVCVTCCFLSGLSGDFSIHDRIQVVVLFCHTQQIYICIVTFDPEEIHSSSKDCILFFSFLFLLIEIGSVALVTVPQLSTSHNMIGWHVASQVSGWRER